MSLNTNGWDYIYTLNVNKLNYPIVSGYNSYAILQEFAIPYPKVSFN